MSTTEQQVQNKLISEKLSILEQSAKESQPNLEIVNAFFEAVKDNNETKVKQLVEELAFVPNTRNIRKQTALHIVPLRKMKYLTRMVECLLDLGVDPYARDEQNWTPIHSFIDACDSEALSIFFKRKLILENDHEEYKRFSEDQLIEATKKGNWEKVNFIVNYLVPCGICNINAISLVDKQTALHIASRKETPHSTLLVEKLKGCGSADHTIKNAENLTPVQVAIQTENQEVLSFYAVNGHACEEDVNFAKEIDKLELAVTLEKGIETFKEKAKHWSRRTY